MSRSVLSLLALFLLASVAVADQVTLKNGDRLTGSIVSGDGKTLLLKTDFAGDVTIQWDAITGIESSESLNLTLKDGKRLSGKIVTHDGKFEVAGVPSAEAGASKDTIVAVRNDAEQKAYDVQAEKLAHPRLNYFWAGIFDTGLALTRGNSATASYTLSAKAIRDTPRDKLTLYSTYIYANDDTSPPNRTTANALRAGARFDYNLSPRTFVFGIADFETNELQNLDLRSVFGGGFGYHVIKNDRTLFDVFGGITYDRDSFSSYINPGPPPVPIAARVLNSAEVVVGEELDQKFSKRTTFTERFSFYPNLSHVGDYRYQFDTTFATQMKAWLSWQLTFSDRYISYPPPGLKGNDLLLSTGLRVTWGNPKF
jgi:putative salt-induced outer membrane protein YdiY